MLKSFLALSLLPGPLFVPAALAAETPTPTDWQLLSRESNAEALSALHLAAGYGLPEWTRMLLAQGAELRLDASGWSPLHLAARNGHCQTLELLLKAHPRLVNQAARNGQTPLQLAVMHHQTQAVSCLLKQGAQPDLADQHGVTPVLQAVLQSQDEMLEHMARNGFAVNSWLQRARPDGRSWLHVLAVLPEMAEPLQLLIRRGVPLQSRFKGQSALLLALEAGYFENVQALLEAGDQVNNAEEAGRLWLALEKYLREDVLQKPAQRALLARLIQTLLRYQDGIIQSPRDQTSLLARRILEGDVLAVDFLLGFGPDLEVRNARNQTFLMLAIAESVPQQGVLVARLLEAGARTDIADEAGNTPLHLAVKRGQADIVRLLLPRVERLSSNAAGQTPLDLARMQGDAELMEELRPLYIRSLFQ
ncbi:MAG: ankyrin repeat domain-containing protein [Candidatus Sericytochromatia bacterium]|nr:ankyrin repeat domain-containing protein [Candidatus Sericytochromatia bacterium]